MAVGGPDVTIEVQDTGSGFTAKAALRVPSPFYTTRNVGLGLGLAVSQKTATPVAPKYQNLLRSFQGGVHPFPFTGVIGNKVGLALVIGICV